MFNLGGAKLLKTGIEFNGTALEEEEVDEDRSIIKQFSVALTKSWAY